MMQSPCVPLKYYCRSDYHPESWLPSWNVSTILVGLQSFMIENDRTVGSIDTTRAQKVDYAGDFNSYTASRCSKP